MHLFLRASTGSLGLNSVKALLLLALISVAIPCQAVDVEYRPGGPKFLKVWERFYAGDHEPELDDPLIEAGRGMTLVICEAIAHQDMKFRRYAIGALGYIGDKRAIPRLEGILKDQKELYYFRGDALHSIYQLNRQLGLRYAEQYEQDNDYLKMMSGAIKKKEPWLLEPTEEH